MERRLQVVKERVNEEDTPENFLLSDRINDLIIVPGVLLNRRPVNAEFFYNGPLRKIGFRYSGPPWVFVTVA
jgi:hypothetical protein